MKQALALFIVCSIWTTTLAHALPDGFDPKWIAGKSNKFQSLMLARLEKIENPQTLEASLVVHGDESRATGYQKQVVIKNYKASVNTLWSALVDQSPNTIWTGPHVNYAASYSKRDHRFYPNDASVPHFHVGQITFNVLNVLGPKVAVAIEVVALDEKNRTIELAYSKGGATDGAQTIQVVADGSNSKLIHTSYYRGESKFRQNVLYPFFHKMMLKEFYGKIQSKLNQN